MSHKVEFVKPDKVNGKSYDKGDTLNVSSSIFKALKDNGSVKEIKQKGQ